MALRHVGVAPVTCLQREHCRRKVLLAKPAAPVDPGILHLMILEAESGSRTEVVVRIGHSMNNQFSV